MRSIDWRELYASNRAVIERARGAPVNLPAGVGAPDGSNAWDKRTFTAAGKTRRALVHRPAGAEPQTVAPLVCMLHGCTQDAASFAAVVAHGGVDGGHAYTRSQWTDRRGVLMHELLEVDGLGHAWSGGAPGGSYTDPRGPDATEAIWRFFEQATAGEPGG